MSQFYSYISLYLQTEYSSGLWEPIHYLQFCLRSNSKPKRSISDLLSPGPVSTPDPLVFYLSDEESRIIS